MMRRVSFPSLILLLGLAIILTPAESSDDVIEETCKKTQYYSLCASTLKSDPRSTAADPAGLAGIALELLLPKANATFTAALKLMESVSAGSATYRFYGTCVDVYGGSVTRDIPNAISELGSKKFAEARVDAARVGSKAAQCESQFGEPNPLTADNSAVHDLATVAADIIGALG